MTPFGLPPRRLGTRPSPSTAWLVLAGMLLATGLAASTAHASPKRRARAARPSAGDESGPVTGKIAVFAFDGDDFTNVRKHVVMVLKDRGFEVDLALRPVQTAEEFRDMGATLDLAAYVHGRIKELAGDRAEATITVRSGVTGRTIASTTFTGFRRGLRFDVEEKLWERVGKTLARVCKEATKPRRPRNEPMHIEAGTPL